MKRMLPALCLTMLLGMGAFFPEASAMELDARPCWQAAPFLASFAQSGEASRDVAEIYSLTWEDTRILAYRASPGTQPEETTYSLNNLEEAGEISGRLRAVILGGYPNFGAEALETRANAWLRGQGMPEMEHLQTSEALFATQITLWRLLEPGAFPDGAAYSGWKDLTAPAWAGYRSRVQDASSLNQVPTDQTEQNIRSLCAYLTNLRPVDGSGTIISDATLERAGYQTIQEEDGTWRVTVEVPLEVSPGEGEAFALRALCDGREQTVRVEEKKTYSFSFSGLASPQAVTVTLEGVQQGADVYLLSAGETVLLGLDQGPVPVRVQTILCPDRILRIRKTTAEDGLPLANIQFNLYLAATREQLETGTVSLGTEPTAREVESCQRPENLTAILSTDENGQAVYNFTAEGAPDGVYLVVEQFCAGTTGPVDPFYITIPSEGSYLQELHLENDLETQPELTLSVTQRGRTEDTFGIGQLQTWYIWGSIPAGMAAAKAYTIWDLLPQGLSHGEDAALVTLETGAGESLRLVPEFHYTMSWEAEELELSLTPAGMAYAAANRGEGIREPGILIAFEASLNEKAPMGQPISHRARLSYVNGAGISYSKTSPWAQVRTGGFSIQKTDPGGRPLAGNTYRLARAAGAGESGVESLTLAGTETSVVYVSFLGSDGIQQETATDAGGRASFSGLPYGSYYLVETRGTDEAPVEIIVDGDSHETGDAPGEDRTVYLVSTRALLPETGGMGAAALTALGTISLISACLLLLATRKRE